MSEHNQAERDELFRQLSATVEHLGELRDNEREKAQLYQDIIAVSDALILMTQPLAPAPRRKWGRRRG